MKAILIALVLIPSAAFASMARQNEFKAAYPAAKALHNCKTCHEATPKLNYYGNDLQANANNPKAVESLDSDGDGKTNLEEINAGTNPGVKN